MFVEENFILLDDKDKSIVQLFQISAFQIFLYLVKTVLQKEFLQKKFSNLSEITTFNAKGKEVKILLKLHLTEKYILKS